MRSLSLRPGDSLTIPKMALSMGFKCSVSLTSAILATGPLVLTLVGLTPTEHASLSWTHNPACDFHRTGLKPLKGHIAVTRLRWQRSLCNTHLKPTHVASDSRPVDGLPVVEVTRGCTRRRTSLRGHLRFPAVA